MKILNYVNSRVCVEKVRHYLAAGAPDPDSASQVEIGDSVGDPVEYSSVLPNRDPLPPAPVCSCTRAVTIADVLVVVQPPVRKKLLPRDSG